MVLSKESGINQIENSFLPNLFLHKQTTVRLACSTCDKNAPKWSLILLILPLITSHAAALTPIG